MSAEKKSKANKPVFLFLGSAVLVAGITLVLIWWPEVVALFKGLSGMFLALGGLLVLYMVRD